MFTGLPGISRTSSVIPINLSALSSRRSGTPVSNGPTRITRNRQTCSGVAASEAACGGTARSHLANDDPAQLLAGAAQRLTWNMGVGRWELVIEATDYVTYEVREVWHGTKAGGNDPVGPYAKQTGCDPTPTFAIEAG